jgi:hypothetical protein
MSVPCASAGPRRLKATGAREDERTAERGASHREESERGENERRRRGESGEKEERNELGLGLGERRPTRRVM